MDLLETSSPPFSTGGEGCRMSELQYYPVNDKIQNAAGNTNC